MEAPISHHVQRESDLIWMHIVYKSTQYIKGVSTVRKEDINVEEGEQRWDVS